MIMTTMRPKVCGIRVSSILFLLLLGCLALTVLNYNLASEEEAAGQGSEGVFNLRQLSEEIESTEKPVFQLESWGNASSQTHKCEVPRLSLKTDVNQFAFHPMPPLVCPMAIPFTLNDSVLRINKTLFETENVTKCSYSTITWENDNLYLTSTPVERKASESFEVKILNEFFKVECFSDMPEGYGFDNSLVQSEEATGSENENYPQNTMRKLLDFEGEKLKIYPAEEKVTKSSHFNKLQNNVSFRNDAINRIHSVQNISTAQLNHKNKVTVTLLPSNLRRNTSKESRGNDLNSNLIQSNKTSVKGNEEEQPQIKSAENITEAQYMGQLYYDAMQYFGGNIPRFQQYFAQVIPKDSVLKHLKNLKSTTDFNSRMNIFIFAMDSMSHLTYQRKLPKTYKYLKTVLKSVVLNAYNIVGDATTAAIIPLTTGHTEAELPEVRKNQPNSTYVDCYPFIWKKFKQKGYVTLHTEDKPDIGTFNLRLNGFRDLPFDHYMRPFYQAVFESSLHQESEAYCTGGRPSHKYMFDYVESLFKRYPRDIPKFAFAFLSDLSHDDNNPAEYVDEDLMHFLQWMKKEGHLQNTLLIVMGDHGARYSKVRKTTQGKLEERLPMMSLRFPDWFVKEYPLAIKNLEANAEKLTTPFDIHATFESLLNLEKLKNQDPPKIKRGMSLLQNIPDDRTCASAGVAPHWCTCMLWQPVNVTNHHVVTAAQKIVEFINNMTSNQRNICSKLKMDIIHDAKLGLPNEKLLKFTKSGDSDQRIANYSKEINSDVFYIQIIVETVPGRGHFESTVIISEKGTLYTVAPDISRINKYGKQANCVVENHPHLRKYCYCKDQGPLPKNQPEKELTKKVVLYGKR